VDVTFLAEAALVAEAAVASKAMVASIFPFGPGVIASPLDYCKGLRFFC